MLDQSEVHELRSIRSHDRRRRPDERNLTIAACVVTDKMGDIQSGHRGTRHGPGSRDPPVAAIDVRERARSRITADGHPPSPPARMPRDLDR